MTDSIGVPGRPPIAGAGTVRIEPDAPEPARSRPAREAGDPGGWRADSERFYTLADLDPLMPIKPSYIKKTGRLLLEQYPSAFSTDFDHNKRSVRALTNIESKTVRNRIAGYVTRKLETQTLA